MLRVEEDGPAGEAAEPQDEDAPLEYDPHAPQVPASKGLGKTMFQQTWGPRPPTSSRSSSSDSHVPCSTAQGTGQEEGDGGDAGDSCQLPLWLYISRTIVPCSWELGLFTRSMEEQNEALGRRQAQNRGAEKVIDPQR